MMTEKSDFPGGDILPETPHSSSHNQVRIRVRHISKTVFGFFLGQGALQGINLVIGLFLVRALSVGDYAKFGLASGFQSTTSILMDLGCASTIIPLVGERALDPTVVGRYVRGAKSLRDSAFWILSPFAAIIFLIITNRQKWPWPIQIALLLTVLLALYSSGPLSYYSATLFLHRRLRAYYFPQTISGAFGLAAYVVDGSWVERLEHYDQRTASGNEKSPICNLAEVQRACYSEGDSSLYFSGYSDNNPWSFSRTSRIVSN
jgi:hypothetical protein